MLKVAVRLGNSSVFACLLVSLVLQWCHPPWLHAWSHWDSTYCNRSRLQALSRLINSANCLMLTLDLSARTQTDANIAFCSASRQILCVSGDKTWFIEPHLMLCEHVAASLAITCQFVCVCTRICFEDGQRWIGNGIWSTDRASGRWHAGVATMESKEMACLIARCNAISSRNCTPLFTLFIEAFGCAVRSFECLILHEKMYVDHSGFDIIRPSVSMKPGKPTATQR